MQIRLIALSEASILPVIENGQTTAERDDEKTVYWLTGLKPEMKINSSSVQKDNKWAPFEDL